MMKNKVNEREQKEMLTIEQLVQARLSGTEVRSRHRLRFHLSTSRGSVFGCRVPKL